VTGKHIRPRGEDIRAFILKRVGEVGLTSKVAKHFAITRQAANRHLQNLTDDGSLIADGNTRSRSYKLAPSASVSFRYKIVPGLAEDVVWTQDIRPFMGILAANVLDIWQWSFTEMFNNAIDHSGGENIYVEISKNAANTEMMVRDDGIGIFKKIQEALGLIDERHAILELWKGKLTTDAINHSGQGIFFTSRMVNTFNILSGGTLFNHELEDENDWMLESQNSASGTTVFLKVDNHTARTVKKTFAQFSVGGSYGFNKTIVPVKLAKYGGDQLVSRSQAKRVLARVDLFAQVWFDFRGVDTIGQAFADQIFRVFANEHPEIKLATVGANREILGVINAAIKSGRPGFKGDLPAV
jgi:hypothetical protein